LSQEEKINFLSKKQSKVSIQDKTCPICGLVFLKKSRMLYHRNSKHDKVPLYTCHICARGFVRRDGYSEHLKTHLNPEEKEQLLAGEST
jgi:transposase-like protein